MTELETRVYNFIKDNTDPDTMECIDMNDLVEGLNESANVLRGVISSLSKKDLIEVEEYDTGFDCTFYYWLKGAFNEVS